MLFRFLLLFLFLSSFIVQAQNATPTISGILDIDASNFLLKTKRVQNMNINLSLSLRFNKLPSIDGVNSFSRFNRVTGLNDTFIRYKETYEYTSSSILLENQIRVSKIDSFNPNGATNFGNAVLSGVLNLIFD